jgi:hypothetical protein
LEEVAEYDQNGIAIEERVNICQARGVCLELLRWWNTKYTTHDVEGGSLGSTAFTTHLLITQAVALLKYKRCAQQDEREGAPGCTLFMLTRQIENILLIIPGEVPGAALREWKRRVCNISDEEDLKLGFSSQDWAHVKIMERDPPQIYGKHFSADTSERDLTPSQRHPQTFSPLVSPHLIRRSWNTLVLGKRRFNVI